MKKIELNIKGMHCNSCAIIIEDTLKEQDGVKDVKVDFKKSKATVSYDEKKTTESKLIQIIKEEDFEATPI